MSVKLRIASDAKGKTGQLSVPVEMMRALLDDQGRADHLTFEPEFNDQGILFRVVAPGTAESAPVPSWAKNGSSRD